MGWILDFFAWLFGLDSVAAPKEETPPPPLPPSSGQRAPDEQRSVAPSTSSSPAGAQLAVPGLVEGDVPRGWFAAVVVHGGGTMGYVLSHMSGRGDRLPWMYEHFEPGGNYGEDNAVIVYANPNCDGYGNGMWVERFCEPPPPSLPGCGPSFFLSYPDHHDHDGDPKYDWPAMGIPSALWQVRMDDKSAKDALQGYDWEDLHPYFGGNGSATPCTPLRLEPGAIQLKDYSNGVQPNNEQEYMNHPITWPKKVAGVGWNATMDEHHHVLLNGHHVRPARAVVHWARWARKFYRSGMGFGTLCDATGLGATFGPTGMPVMPDQTRKPALISEEEWDAAIKVPAYYRTSPARLNDWWRRLCLWYHRAAWVVWAAEVYRCHGTKGPGNPPDWWRTHCLRWGVGVVKESAKERRPPKSELHHHTAWSVVEATLKQVKKHTPVPGSPQSLGSQIAPGTVVGGKAKYKRALLDMPVAAGSIDPPCSVEWWKATTIQNANNAHQGASSTGADWVAGVLQVEASLCGAGFGSAAAGFATSLITSAAVASIVSKCVSVAVQNCFKMAMGEPPADVWSWGDVVGVFSEAANVIGAEVEIPTVLPNEMWDALKAGGSSFPSIPGVDNDQLFGHLNHIQSVFSELEESGWDYFDDAYGGLGLAENAKDAVNGAVKLF